MIMNLQIKIVAISFMISIMVSLIVLPILKKLKIGQIEREYGPRSHLIKQGTPTMGGIVIAITLIIEVALLCTTHKEILPLAIIILGFGLVGLVDDFKKLILKDTEGLKPAYKIVGLLLVSVVYALYIIKSGIGTGTIIPGLKLEIVLPTLIYIPFAIVVMLAGTNAVNLTDGIDGLRSIYIYDNNSMPLSNCS